MKLKFIKNHPVGIKVGKIVSVDNKYGEKLLKDGFVELFVEEEKEIKKEEKVSKAKKPTEKKPTVTKEDKLDSVKRTGPSSSKKEK